MSEIDDIFEGIYGYKPKKKGTGFEMLAAAVAKLLSPESKVMHDMQERGEHSKSLYQIDIRQNTCNSASFGEAKDYTDRGAKVGRGDLQKLGGALPDLFNIDKGAFYSATGYTKPASAYANSAEQIIGKPIDLYNLRPSVEKDLEGRVLTIHYRIHALTPDFEKAELKEVWTDQAKIQFKKLMESGEFPATVSFDLNTIYDVQGRPNYLLSDFFQRDFGGQRGEDAEGVFLTPGGNLKVLEALHPIHGIHYKIPFHKHTEEVQISADGDAKLLLKSEDGEVDKIIRDLQLKQVYFDENGEAHLKNRGLSH